MAKKISETSALEDAYLLLRKKLGTIGRACNVSESEAEDLLQDGYLRLAGNVLNDKQEAKGKLWVTIRNLAVDRFRRNKYKQSVNELELKNLGCEPVMVADWVFIKYQMERILSPIQYQIMRLLVEEDLDYPEIAERLEMNEGAIRTNVSRARKKLKEKMEL